MASKAPLRRVYIALKSFELGAGDCLWASCSVEPVWTVSGRLFWAKIAKIGENFTQFSPKNFWKFSQISPKLPTLSFGWPHAFQAKHRGHCLAPNGANGHRRIERREISQLPAPIDHFGAWANFHKDNKWARVANLPIRARFLGPNSPLPAGQHSLESSRER